MHPRQHRVPSSPSVLPDIAPREGGKSHVVSRGNVAPHSGLLSQTTSPPFDGVEEPWLEKRRRCRSAFPLPRSTGERRRAQRGGVEVELPSRVHMRRQCPREQGHACFRDAPPPPPEPAHGPAFGRTRGAVPGGRVPAALQRPGVRRPSIVPPARWICLRPTGCSPPALQGRIRSCGRPRCRVPPLQSKVGIHAKHGGRCPLRPRRRFFHRRCRKAVREGGGRTANFAKVRLLPG